MTNEVSLVDMVKEIETRGEHLSLCEVYKTMDDYVKAHVVDGKYVGDSHILVNFGHVVDFLKREYIKMHTK